MSFTIKDLLIQENFGIMSSQPCKKLRGLCPEQQLMSTVPRFSQNNYLGLIDSAVQALPSIIVSTIYSLLTHLLIKKHYYTFSSHSLNSQGPQPTLCIFRLFCL